MSLPRRKTMFGRARSYKLAKMVKMDSPANARVGASMLVKHFHKLEKRPSKVATKRAAVLASSRARAMLKKKNLSPKERREFREIARIYEKAYKTMRLD